MAAEIAGQTPLVGDELLPAEITGVRRLEANLPVLKGHLRDPATASRSTAGRIHSAAAIDIGSSIGGILKNGANAPAIRLPPDHLVGSRPDERANRQQQAVPAQGSHAGPCALQVAEFAEDEAETRLNLFLGAQDDVTRSAVSEPCRKGKAKLTPGSLLALTLMKTQLDLMQFSLAHDPGQTEQQTVVVGTRIIEPLVIGNEDTEERTQFEQLVPIAIVAGQTRGIQADHQACIAQSDFGDQLLEALAIGSPGAGFAEILVNDVDPITWPAQPGGPVHQVVLQVRAFLMMPDLIHRGLAHVDVSKLRTAGCRQPLIGPVRDRPHQPPPSSSDRSSGSAEPHQRGLRRPAFARRPEARSMVLAAPEASAGGLGSGLASPTQRDAGTSEWPS